MADLYADQVADLVRSDLSFFDKIINVTFFKWVTTAEGVAELTAAFTIRSDRPWFGYDYFQDVKPPDMGSPTNYIVPGDLNSRTGFGAGASSFLAGAGKKLGLKEIDYYGPKPNIRLNLTQLQETVCTAVTLTIENLTLQVAIEDFTAMQIEAGYSYGQGVNLTQKFFVSIFSSYVETPNPAGRSVFTGVVGNWLVKGLRAQPYTIFIEPGLSWAKTGYSIRERVVIICSYLGIIPVIDLPDYMLDLPLEQDTMIKGRAQTGYQVIDWLAKSLMELTYEWRVTPGPTEGMSVLEQDDMIMARFYDNIFHVYLLRQATKENISKTTVDLNRISSASFQGGILTVLAPWNPLLRPGEFFHMYSTFFRGRMMPNISHGILQDELGIYRPITMDITFETVGGTNQMKIVAAPARLTSPIGSFNDEVVQQEVKTTATNEEGKPNRVNLQRAQQLEAMATQNMSKGRSTNFYQGEGNPYRVGILANNSIPAIDEVKRREKEALRVNSNDSILINQDIVIVLNQESISNWYQLNAQEKEITVNATIPRETDQREKPLTQPAVLTLSDPARMSKYYNLAEVDGARAGEMSLLFNDWNDVRAFLNTMYEKQYMTDQLAYVGKSAGLGRGERVHLIYLIRVLGSLITYKEFQRFIDENQRDPTTFKDIWRANVYSLVPIADVTTNVQVSALFPPANMDFNYRIFYVPIINSPDDLTYLVNRHKEYIRACINYWQEIRKQASFLPYSVSVTEKEYKKILTWILDWVENWPDKPWDGYTDGALSEGNAREVW